MGVQDNRTLVQVKPLKDEVRKHFLVKLVESMNSAFNSPGPTIKH